MNRRNVKNQLNLDNLKGSEEQVKESKRIMNFQNNLRTVKENKARVKNRAKNKAKRKMQQKQRGK